MAGRRAGRATRAANPSGTATATPDGPEHGVPAGAVAGGEGRDHEGVDAGQSVNHFAAAAGSDQLESLVAVGDDVGTRAMYRVRPPAYGM